jgi:hypothetical protein
VTAAKYAGKRDICSDDKGRLAQNRALATAVRVLPPPVSASFRTIQPQFHLAQLILAKLACRKTINSQNYYSFLALSAYLLLPKIRAATCGHLPGQFDGHLPRPETPAFANCWLWRTSRDAAKGRQKVKGKTRINKDERG